MCFIIQMNKLLFIFYYSNLFNDFIINIPIENISDYNESMF